MERPVFLSKRDQEIVDSLGGESYEPEDSFSRGETHYSDRGGHKERSRFHKELAKQAISWGSALLLVSCVPSGSEAYTLPGGVIVYNNGSQNNEQIVKHEETHRDRSLAGGVMWWVRYWADLEFRCNEEIIANEVAGIFPVDEHPYCE